MDRDAGPLLHQNLYCDQIYYEIWQSQVPPSPLSSPAVFGCGARSLTGMGGWEVTGMSCPGVRIPHTIIYRYYEASPPPLPLPLAPNPLGGGRWRNGSSRGGMARWSDGGRLELAEGTPG